MIRKDITESMIQNVLMNRKELLSRISMRVNFLFETMQDLDDEIRSVSIGQKNYDAIYGGTSNKRRELIDTLQQIYYRKNKYIEEIKAEILFLLDEEDTIRRIWTCFHALPLLENEVLRRLYVERQSWKQAKAEMKINHRIFVSLRKSGFEQIIYLYHENYSNHQIRDMSEIKLRKRRNLAYEKKE